MRQLQFGVVSVDSKKFMRELRKKFPDNEISLRKKGDYETVVVDEKEIKIKWIPHLNKIRDAGAINTLLDDCVKSIDSSPTTE